MNISELISSGLLESYVLGTASAEEKALITDLCKKHPELVKEIESIEASLINFSSQLNAPLNSKLKDKIFAGLEEKTAGTEKPAHEAAIIPLHQSKLKFYKRIMAASLFLAFVSIAYVAFLQAKLKRLNGELSAMNAGKSYMANELLIQQASMSNMENELQIVTDPRIKKIILSGMNTLASKSAAVHWNTETKEVYFNARAMPPPGNKQYQLWAIVNGKPVDAGVINLPGDTVFQRMKTISEAQAFAVTIEKQGKRYAKPRDNVFTGQCITGAGSAAFLLDVICNRKTYYLVH